jgi:23S rRNA G2445 N2-methylase RlmL
VSIERGDARRLERSITRGAYPLAIVNPPFGRRIGSTANVVGLYRDFALSARRCEVDTVVAIVESGRSMRGALEDAGYNVVRSISVRYGELPAQVILARGAAAC